MTKKKVTKRKSQKKPKKELKKVGRKWFDGKNEDKVRAKLEEAWIMGCPNSEACLLADISPYSLRRYLKAHKKFRQKKKALLEAPNLKARKTVISKLGESYSNAIDYLSRKKKDEFSPRSEVLDETARQEIEKLRKVLGNIFNNDKNTPK